MLSTRPGCSATTHVTAEAVIQLSVNGEKRQEGVIGAMIWNVAETIEILSKYFTLQPGDTLEGSIAGLGELRVRIA